MSELDTLFNLIYTWSSSSSTALLSLSSLSLSLLSSSVSFSFESLSFSFESLSSSVSVELSPTPVSFSFVDSMNTKTNTHSIRFDAGAHASCYRTFCFCVYLYNTFAFHSSYSHITCLKKFKKMNNNTKIFQCFHFIFKNKFSSEII